MHFASLTLNSLRMGAHPEIMPTTGFHQKIEKKNFHFFFKIIQYPLNGIFQINFYVRVPLNITKTIFIRKKSPKSRFLYFCYKMV